MGFDSNRRALRASLPLLLGGFALLAIATALVAVPAADLLRPLVERLQFETLSAVLGALGSGLMLVGAAQLARAKIAGRYSLALLAFFALWLGEFLVRAWMMASVEARFDLLLLRLLLAACSMVALSTGMTWIWDRNAPRNLLVSWRRTRGLFLFQLVVAPALALSGVVTAGGAGGDGTHELNTMGAALWLAFIIPYAHLLASLRRSVIGVSQRESVAEFLTS